MTLEQQKHTIRSPNIPDNSNKKENVEIYAWHCNHHFAHIAQLMIRKNWK
ncbi:hypothetical protein [Polaribacter sp. SA4-10]|nr:hypothetical protein [Polaribacter sp. SA4-10]